MNAEIIVTIETEEQERILLKLVNGRKEYIKKGFRVFLSVEETSNGRRIRCTGHNGRIHNTCRELSDINVDRFIDLYFSLEDSADYKNVVKRSYK